MFHLYASIGIGIAATLLALLLLLLRLEIGGRRLALALTRRWVATDARASALVLSLLGATATGAFVLMPETGDFHPMNEAAPPSRQATSPAPHNVPDADPELAALRAYADAKGPAEPSASAKAAAPDDAGLPDVDTMITKLTARLKTQPDDVSGWKTLGWSYLNTGRPQEAVKAYETALELDPADKDIVEALKAAKAMPMP